MIAWQDAVNGCFELLGAPLTLLSILKLSKDKIVRGVSWYPVFFFSLWGLWNIEFYSHLNQWCSFWGGILLAGTNTFWLFQMWFYIKKEKNKIPFRYTEKGLNRLVKLIKES